MIEFLKKEDLQKTKFLIHLNIQETIRLLDIIDNNNSEVDSQKIFSSLNGFPFTQNVNNKLEFKQDIKKTLSSLMLNVSVIDGLTPIVSLISVRDKLNNKIYSLLSLEILNNYEIGEVYINYSLLKKMNFNEYNKMKLIKSESDFDLDSILDILKDGLVGRGMIANRFQLNDFGERNIQNKITKIQEIIHALYNQKYETLTNFLIYKSGDLDLNKYTKIDYVNLNKKLENNKSFDNFFNLLKYYDQNIFNKTYRTNLFNLDLNSLNETFTLSQRISAKNASSENFSIIHGFPGCGKTYVAMQIIINNLYLSAVSKSNFNENLNFLFTTYNKKSLNDFKQRFVELKIENLLFINDEMDSNFNNVLEFLHLKYKNGINFNEREKFEKIDSRLKSEFSSTKEILSKYFELKEIKTQINNLLQLEDSVEAIRNLSSLLEKNNTLSFFDKILYNFGIETNKKIILIHKNIMKGLKGIIKFNNYEDDFKISLYNAEKIALNLEKYKQVAKRKIKKINSDIILFLDELEKTLNTIISTNKETNNIPMEDIIFYLENYPLVHNTDNSEKTLKYLKTNEYSNKTEKENLFNILNGKQNIVKNICNIFPVHLSVVSKIGKTYSLDEIFDLTIVDEAYQTPGYFFLPLVSRSGNIISIGDNGQLENDGLYNKGTQNNLYKEIYNLNDSVVFKKTKKTHIPDKQIEQNEIYSFYDKYGTSKIDNNIFNLLKNINKNTNNMLIDNFRSNRDIVFATLFTSYKYQDLVKNFIDKNEVFFTDKDYHEFLTNELKNWNNDSIYKIVNTTINRQEIFYTLRKQEVRGSLFYCNTGFINDFSSGILEKTYIEIFNFINNNKDSLKNLKGSDILIITPFKQDANVINEFLTKSQNKLPNIINGILCESVENIQGIERKVVIFDSGIYSEHNEQLSYITEKPEVLTVAISRAKNMFIFMGNISYIKDISSENILYKLFSETDKFKFNNIE